MHTFARILACLVIVSWSTSGCRGPRDPDLDRRLQESRIERELPAPEPAASGGTPRGAATQASAKQEDKGAKHGLPPAGSVEQRRYSAAELDTIFKAVPRASGIPPEATELDYTVLLETGEGDITCRLDKAEAPQTVANFIAIATGQRAWRDPDTKEILKDRMFYDGLTFHRAIKDFIIQTGKPGTGSSTGPGWTIPSEEGVQARYEEPGAMGMVDAGEDSHGSQFFITLRGQKSLKGKYTPFGVCELGDVAKRIANAEKHPPTQEGKSATKPLKRVLLKRLRVEATQPTAPATATETAPAAPPQNP